MTHAPVHGWTQARAHTGTQTCERAPREGGEGERERERKRERDRKRERERERERE